MPSAPKQKDLFDDSVMSFGEHLEVLRVHLVRALLGLMVTMVFTLAYGESIVRFIRQPIDDALNRYSLVIRQSSVEVTGDIQGFNFWTEVGGWIRRQFTGSDTTIKQEDLQKANDPVAQRVVTLELSAFQLLQQLHQASPDQFPAPPETLQDKQLKLDVESDDFRGLRTTVQRLAKPITLNVTEAFFTYFKVSLISGLIFSSPWILYQMWLFVAAGLYPHERKYVYMYLPASVGLFLGGAGFCYYAVFPTVLNFLIEFNVRLELTPQIRISEYINFAVMFPLMFGISFQLPLVMLFLQKLSIFDVASYREKRKLAILGIALVAMLLTPTPDPFSMLMMMVPLMGLYELGIALCLWTESSASNLTTAVWLLIAVQPMCELGASAAAAEPVPPQRAAVDQRAAKVEYVAHRGASFDAPENTLAAIREGWKQRADAVEFDVWLTRDHRIVLLHDRSLQRTTGVDRLIDEVTWPELQGLDAGRWKLPAFVGEPIPRLAEALETIPPTRRVLIEVKCGPEIVPHLAAVLRDSGVAADQAAIISFQDTVVAAAKQALPLHRVYWVVNLRQDEQTGAWNHTVDGLIDRAKALRADGLDLRAVPLIDQTFAQQVHAAGLELLVWTVNDPEVARAMLDAGVTGITTDRPGWLRDQLQPKVLDGPAP
jgi:sec-independent protein translocase protein TatC